MNLIWLNRETHGTESLKTDHCNVISFPSHRPVLAVRNIGYIPILLLVCSVHASNILHKLTAVYDCSWESQCIHDIQHDDITA